MNLEEQNIISEKPVVKPVMGVVVDCNRLNVRRHPTIRGDILCEIKVGTSVVVDEEASIGNFYKICTVSGIEGFCMKEFIEIHK